MSKTLQDVLSAFSYYIGNGGYYEKANATAKYLTRDVSNFAKNRGSANYTYMGKLCGVNPGQWCAMMVSTAVYEGCGSDKTAARSALWGVWPFTVCSSLWNAADDNHRFYGYYQRYTKGKGDRANYTPEPGDVILFSNDTVHFAHTGMVYAVDSSTVYTYEGNSGNMARKRSYSLKSSYIYGYVKLNLPKGEDPADTDQVRNIKTYQKWLSVTQDGEYGPITKAAAIKAHQAYLDRTYKAGLELDGEWGPLTYYSTESVQKGDVNDDVTIWQGLLYCLGQDPVGIDGEFGPNTEKATQALQIKLGLNGTGIADRYTWAKAFGAGKPDHTILRSGSTGAEVKYLQRRLTERGFATETTGRYDANTIAAVKAFQKANELSVDGVCGPKTWAKLD